MEIRIVRVLAVIIACGCSAFLPVSWFVYHIAGGFDEHAANNATVFYNCGNVALILALAGFLLAFLMWKTKL